MNIQKLKPFLALSAAILLQACLGGIYAWSVFVPSLKETFGFSSADMQLVFGIGLLSHTTSMIFVGKIINLISYRKLICLSALFTTSGYLVAGYFGDKIWILFLSIGLLNGIGIACGYLPAIQNGISWFNKKGLVTGISVSGYGGGAVLLSLISEYLFAKGWQVLEIFKLIGLVYGSLILLTSLFFFEVADQRKSKDNKFSIKDLVREFKKAKLLLKDSRLWALVSGITFGSYPAVALIGSIKPIALYYKYPFAINSLAVSFIAIGSAFGRIIWGSLQDKIGNLKTTAFSLLSVFLSVLFLYLGYLDSLVFLFSCFWVGFSFGSCFSIYPAQTAQFFGTKRLGDIYPFVLWFHGIAALFGPWITGFTLDQSDSYNQAFLIAALCSLLGFVLYFFLVKKTKVSRG